MEKRKGKDKHFPSISHYGRLSFHFACNLNLPTKKLEHSAATPSMSWAGYVGKELTTQVAEKEGLRPSLPGKFAWWAAESI